MPSKDRSAPTHFSVLQEIYLHGHYQGPSIRRATLASLERALSDGWLGNLLSKSLNLRTSLKKFLPSFTLTTGRVSRLGKDLLKRVSALENSATGVWAITSLGEALRPEDVASIPSIVRRQDYERRRLDQSDGEAIGEEAGETNKAPPEENWKDQLLAVVKGMSPGGFECPSQRLLREAGFIKVEATGRSGDGGIDGIGVLRVNLLSFQVLFQCKRYNGSVGASAVRDFRGAMVGRSEPHHHHRDFLQRCSAGGNTRRCSAIDLIEGDMLCDFLKSLQLGVTLRIVEEVIVDAEWFSKV